MSAVDRDSSESFRGLVLQLRGRLDLTQRELAARLGVHPNSIQAWEAGTSYPGLPSRRALIEAAARAGAFHQGTEIVEATQLWDAATRESSRTRAPFDRAWFASLMGSPGAPAREADPADEPAASGPATARERRPAETRRQSWSDALDVAGFLGRTEERELLGRWVVEDRCRVVAVLGLGGIGKTLLTARIARDVAPHFDFVYWRSLRDAPARSTPGASGTWP